MNITKLDIELLMVASRWDNPVDHPEWISNDGFRSRKWLEAEGLLDGRHVTQRGAEYIKRLLAVPVDLPLKIDIPLAEPDQKDTRGFATPRTWSDVVDTRGRPSCDTKSQPIIKEVSLEDAMRKMVAEELIKVHARIDKLKEEVDQWGTDFTAIEEARQMSAKVKRIAEALIRGDL